jgi:hypothetical protein
MVGKAARNEARKITASYLNSLAVALAVGGVAIPFVGAMSRTRDEVAQWVASQFTWETLFEPTALSSAIFAIVLSLVFHVLARRCAERVEE